MIIYPNIEQNQPKMSLKNHKLRRNSDFRRVFYRGFSVANRFYVLYVIKKDLTRNTNVGFSVSKKVGNAVIRNRVKRIGREVVRKEIFRFSHGYDLVIIARHDAANLTFWQARDFLMQLLRKAKLIE